jgi:hypothetical protein
MEPNTGFVRGGTELIDIDPFETVPTDTTTADTSASVVRIDALRNFRQVVDGLSGARESARGGILSNDGPPARAGSE